jgi:hypothetical protein
MSRLTSNLSSVTYVLNSDTSGRATSWLRFDSAFRFSPLTRFVKPPGMRVRFPLGLSVESDARDLSLAESDVHGLRSQMPVSSLPSSHLELGNVLTVREPICRRRTQLELWAVSGTRPGSQPRHGRCIAAKPPLSRLGLRGRPIRPAGHTLRRLHPPQCRSGRQRGRGCGSCR